MTTNEAGTADGSRQQLQQSLVEQAVKVPGVMEAVQIYGAVAERSVAVVVTPEAVRYATGVNG